MIPPNTYSPIDSVTHRTASWVKQKIKTLSFQAGLHPAIHNLVSFQPTTLLYHKVQRRSVGLWGEPALSVLEFAAQLEFLTRHFEVVPFRRVVEALQGKASLPKRAIAITFDDGYQNNLLLAAPVLKKYHVPATFFISTGLVGTQRWMWAYELEELFLRFSPADIGRVSGNAEFERLCQKPAAVFDVCMDGVDFLKTLPHRELLEILHRLQSHFQVDVDDENRFLSWDEVRTLHAEGFEIAAHSVTHPILTRVSLTEAEREMRQSQADIEDILGVRPTLFAYPNGDTSEALCILASRYFEASVTTQTAFAIDQHTLQSLPRLSAPSSVAELSFELARRPFVDASFGASP